MTQVMEVRRREPGAMIRQRLQNLRDQVVSGRRDSSEDRQYGYARSKSLPPSQYRSSLLHSSSQSSLSSTASGCGAEGTSGLVSHQTRCSDDIFVNDRRVTGSRDSLVSLPSGAQPVTLWGSRESVFCPSVLGSRSKERLNSFERLTSSKERLYSSRESILKDKHSSSIDLKRSGSKEHITRETFKGSPVLSRKDINSRHAYQRPHPPHPLSPATAFVSSPTTSDGDSAKQERDLSARFSMPPPSQPGPMSQWERTNQFVHRARSSSDRSTVSLSEQPSSPISISSDAGTKGVKVSSSFSNPSPLLDQQQQQMSRSTGRLDQLSTEVDNLVIMKGWVRSLISRFQEQP